MSVPITSPQKTDVSTPCACGGVMQITAVAPSTTDQKQMVHTFACPQCQAQEFFVFLKAVRAAARV